MNKTRTFITAASLAMTMMATAQNPIVQTCFSTDPAPVAFGDRCYVYTGHDEDGADFFWMQEWRAYSSDDMVNWTDHGSPLAIEDFTWGDDRAWASQVIERGGKYYFYVCLHSTLKGGMAIGVAVSDNPAGPFKDALGKPLYDDGKWDNIDPTVFIDVDGTAHLYWGNPVLHHAVLNDDMVSIRSHEVVEQGTESFGLGKPSKEEPSKYYGSSYTEGPWAFTQVLGEKLNKNGLTIKKGKNAYYMLYAAGGIPEHIAYSMAPTPSGPWTYMGQIMPEGGTGSFTNHCGVVRFKGHDYFFYHTGWLPGGGGFGRSMSVEEFQFNSDGTFPTIRPTKEGVKPLKAFNPYGKVEGETMAWSRGIHTASCDERGVYVCDIHNGDFIKLQNVDFDATKNGNVRLTVSAATGLRGGTMELRLDSIRGQKFAEVAVTGTGGWESFKEFTANLTTQPTGVHDLYLVFKGRKGPKLFNLDWWKLMD